MATSLKRYTDLTSLLHIVSTSSITLLNPESWEDTNDSHYISIYKKKKNLKSVLALCFTEANETYHHWRVFAEGHGGVCIYFDKELLLSSFDKEEYSKGSAQYEEIKKLEHRKLTIQELPYIKRHAFIDEREYRLLYESAEYEKEYHAVPIDLNCIRQVKFSPWIHDSVYEESKKILKKIWVGDKPRFTKSRVIDNPHWKKIGVRAA